MNAETMTPEAMTDDDRWASVLRRDRALDGRFVTGVLTTGIYCRPSCAARHPARGNVRFFADGAAAREAGLRPCKRCLPDDVARDERGPEELRSHLTSETGLVYTLLAHAAGRLG